MDNDYVNLWTKDIPEDLRDRTNEIIEEYRHLELRCEPATRWQSQALFIRAIVIVAIKNMPWEISLTEIVGRWIDRTSDKKEVRREVEDIYFRLLSQESTIDVNTSYIVLIKAVKEYNQKHGYLGRHTRK
jgi:hypothetical protein